MSHELRTPLNSLLILSRILEENAQDVLDLSKIESGTLAVELMEVPFREILQFAERTFLPVAEGKGLRFPVSLDPGLPRGIRTDPRRLQQVIRNLLSNAFKFTEQGIRNRKGLVWFCLLGSALHQGFRLQSHLLSVKTSKGFPLPHRVQPVSAKQGRGGGHHGVNLPKIRRFASSFLHNFSI